MKKTAIMGFGNPARSDDGVGCFVIELLRREWAELPGLTLLDMGSSAFEVLFQLQGHERIIVVDAVVNTGEADGALYRLPASEVEAEVEDDPMVFLHSLKWNQALSYAKKILRDDYPEDIQVYLTAISNTRLEIGLSLPVSEAAQRVVELIRQDLALPIPA